MGKPKAKAKPGSAKASERVVSKKITTKHDINSILDKAEEYMDDLNIELAQKFCERALQIDNDNVRALELTASLLLDMGEVEQAQNCLGRAIFVEPQTGHSKYLTMAQLMTGVESRDLYHKGIELIQKLISSLPTSDERLADLRRSLSNAMISISEIYITDLCDEPEAEEESKKFIKSAIEADPSNPEAFQAQANYALIVEEIETAKTAIDKSLQLWLPDQLKFIEENTGKETTLSYEFRISTVKILLDLEDYDNAVTILDSLLQEDEEEVNTWYLLGWSNYLRCKEEAEYAGNARHYLEKALTVNKKNPTDDEDLIEHITTLIDELKEMGADADDADDKESDDENEPRISELEPDQIAEILDKEAEERVTEEENKMQE